MKSKEPKLELFEVGQTVRLGGTHPFKGHMGKIVAFQKIGLRPNEVRPRVRLFDMHDHEVFIMVDSDAQIIAPRETP